MLREIKNLRQEAGAGRRRWFESEAFDLIVWLGKSEEVEGFQICYDLGQGERALTWRSGTGFAHSRVDQGDATPFKNEAPVLVPSGAVPWQRLRREFDVRGAGLEPALRALVIEKLAAEARAR